MDSPDILTVADIIRRVQNTLTFYFKCVVGVRLARKAIKVVSSGTHFVTILGKRIGAFATEISLTNEY